VALPVCVAGGGYPRRMTENRPLAVVTGASSGIGFELAKQFALHGFDLLINSEDDRLIAATDELRRTGAGVQPVRTDLRGGEGVEQVHSAVRAMGRPVAVAAFNAGVGQGGAFIDNDLADELAVIDLNITSSVHLAKRLLPEMVRRGTGRALFTSSVAATVPGSHQAVYNASKSFLQSFAEALREELKGTGVTVTSVMPGPTETDFFRRAGMEEDTRIGRRPKDDAALVGEQAYEAVMRGRGRVVTGSASTRAQGVVSKVLPDKLKAAVHRRLAEPGAADSH
jgi:uncharacterized protein